MTTRFPLRSLLWLDCTAAGLVGGAMLALSGPLAAVFGIPRAVVVGMALMNLLYGSFSYSLARRSEPPRRRVIALVTANFVWAAICVGLAALLAGPNSWLGATYILVEGVVVGTLAAVEARALAQWPG